MITISAPILGLPREEWPDADFDLPDGEPLHACSDKDDNNDEDWDLEMDFGRTGGAKVTASIGAILESTRKVPFTIRPPITLDEDEDNEDDEGVSTIKVAALQNHILKVSSPAPIDEDIESAFALPSNLTQLSLVPLSLNHRSSKNSLEWGDKDQTSSSQSSDAYSSLGFADASPSSNSASSVSLPGSETDEDEDEDEDELDGLVIPSGLFESNHGARQLTKILETKKKVQITDNQIKVATPDPEDDFEMGLVIDDDVDLSPSRLLFNAQQQKFQHVFSRCNSMPPRSTSLRPPSRLKNERAKSPHPPPSSTRQFQKLRLSPSPPLRPTPPTRSQTFQPFSSASPPSSCSSSFLSPKPGSLRGQKSTSVLKPPTPPSTQRKLTRKASLSSLTEAGKPQASGSGSSSAAGLSNKLLRYEAPTAASRAKLHNASTSRAHGVDYMIPPTRPSTPSANPAALRLTMPTSSRHKTRPALASVFSPTVAPASHTPLTRSSPPLPLRPPSSLSGKSRSLQAQSVPQPSAPRVLRRPKRQRTYGDGTELDGFDDLPTDGDKEGRYRVQPKGYGNRVPGASYPLKLDKAALRKKNKRDVSGGSIESTALAPSTNTLKRTGRIEFPPTPDLSGKRKKNVPSPQHGLTKRKPTLIRNLGGSGAPKVVGDMKWNPLTLRWEGNDHILRDFDAAVGTSTRPALITHLTGSSIGSPVGSFASGARIVGNMIFDPARMCWISTLPPDEDEPDIFANMADDEEDGDSWESKGGTIRACVQQTPASESSHNSTTLTLPEAPSPARSHTRTLSESGSDRGSRASMAYDVDDAFLESCRLAEHRHRLEMKGWKTRQADVFAEPDRSNLYEIRALATRKY